MCMCTSVAETHRTCRPCCSYACHNKVLEGAGVLLKIRTGREIAPHSPHPTSTTKKVKEDKQSVSLEGDKRSGQLEIKEVSVDACM